MTSLKLPKPVLQKMCEEWAIQVRDGVNSHLGVDRLKIHMFFPWEDDSVTIFYEDADGPDNAHLTIGWEHDSDAVATIDYLIENFSEVDYVES